MRLKSGICYRISDFLTTDKNKFFIHKGGGEQIQVTALFYFQFLPNVLLPKGAVPDGKVGLFCVWEGLVKVGRIYSAGANHLESPALHFWLERL